MPSSAPQAVQRRSEAHQANLASWRAGLVWVPFAPGGYTLLEIQMFHSKMAAPALMHSASLASVLALPFCPLRPASSPSPALASPTRPSPCLCPARPTCSAHARGWLGPRERQDAGRLFRGRSSRFGIGGLGVPHKWSSYLGPDTDFRDLRSAWHRPYSHLQHVAPFLPESPARAPSAPALPRLELVACVQSVSQNVVPSAGVAAGGVPAAILHISSDY